MVLLSFSLLDSPSTGQLNTIVTITVTTFDAWQSSKRSKRSPSTRRPTTAVSYTPIYYGPGSLKSRLLRRGGGCPTADPAIVKDCSCCKGYLIPAPSSSASVFVRPKSKHRGVHTEGKGSHQAIGKQPDASGRTLHWKTRPGTARKF